jgi:hypothetical protein
MQVESTTITTTAACSLGNCQGCRGTVYTLTTGLGSPLRPCQHVCHLPDAWKEQATLTPPCEDDAVLDHDELDDLLAEEADRRNDDLAIGAWS